MRYIIDTHSLVWYFTKDKRLSKKAKNILQGAEQDRDEIIIPIIVLLEVIDIQEKKKIAFKTEELFDFLEKKENFKIIDLNLLLVKEIIKIGRGLDLHDRIIVATANFWDAKIISKDRLIKEYFPKKVIW